MNYPTIFQAGLFTPSPSLPAQTSQKVVKSSRFQYVPTLLLCLTDVYIQYIYVYLYTSDSVLLTSLARQLHYLYIAKKILHIYAKNLTEW